MLIAPIIFVSIVFYGSIFEGPTPTIPAKWKIISDRDTISVIGSESKILHRDGMHPSGKFEECTGFLMTAKTLWESSKSDFIRL